VCMMVSENSDFSVQLVVGTIRDKADIIWVFVSCWLFTDFKHIFHCFFLFCCPFLSNCVFVVLSSILP